MTDDRDITDEEMAEKYANNEVPFDTTESGEKLYTKNDLKYAYFAGLKAGKDRNVPTKWHKVADGDYPPCEKGNYTINVLTDKRYGILAVGFYECFGDPTLQGHFHGKMPEQTVQKREAIPIQS